MGFLEELKLIKWDLCGASYQYKQAFLSTIPGYLGIACRRYFYRKLFAAYGEETIILEGVTIRNPHKISIGYHSDIGPGSFIQAAGGLEIGDHAIIGPGVKIWTSNHRYDDINTPIYFQGSVEKQVVIEDDVWIGANAFIMPGAHIGRGSVVSACSVVGGKRYKEYSILAGNPARVIGFRNQNHAINEGK